jgi:hypothetical protein
MPDKPTTQFEQPSSALLLANKYVWVILLTVVVVTLFLGYFLVLQSSFSNIGSARNDTSAVNEDVQTLSDLKNKVAQLEQEFSAVEAQRMSELRKLHSILPSEPQVAELFVLAERLALLKGFYLSAIDVVQEQAVVGEDGEDILGPSGLSSLSIKMDVTQIIDEDNPPTEDPYDLFKQYLDDLESNVRLMDVETVSFSGIEGGAEGGEGAAGLSLSFTLNTYFISN